MKPIKKGSLVALLLLLCFYANAQSFLDQKIRLPPGERGLKTVLEDIGTAAGITLSYSSNQLPAGGRVTIPARELSLREALDIVLKNTGLTYSDVNGQIILSKPAKKGRKDTPIFTAPPIKQAQVPILSAFTVLRCLLTLYTCTTRM
jgi:hypothetical protein